MRGKGQTAEETENSCFSVSGLRENIFQTVTRNVERYHSQSETKGSFAVNVGITPGFAVFFLLGETLKKSSAADAPIFCPSRADSQAGNTQSIPPLVNLSPEPKSWDLSSCRFHQSFPGNYSPMKQKGKKRP